MADIKTGVFAKNVQKRLNRAQEKVSGPGGAGRGDAGTPPALPSARPLRRAPPGPAPGAPGRLPALPAGAAAPAPAPSRLSVPARRLPRRL